MPTAEKSEEMAAAKAARADDKVELRLEWARIWTPASDAANKSTVESSKPAGGSAAPSAFDSLLFPVFSIVITPLFNDDHPLAQSAAAEAQWRAAISRVE